MKWDSPMKRIIFFWLNCSDLTRPYPKWWWGNSLFNSGKSRLVIYYFIWPDNFMLMGCMFCLFCTSVDDCRDAPFFRRTQEKDGAANTHDMSTSRRDDVSFCCTGDCCEAGTLGWLVGGLWIGAVAPYKKLISFACFRWLCLLCTMVNHH